MNQASPCYIRAANRQRAHEAEAPTLAFEVATPSSAEPTVSTLTTEGGGGDEEEREDGVREEGGKEGERLPSLKSVFDCSYIKTKTVNDCKDGWECWWCSKIFAPRHALRALGHVLKMKGGNIAVCKAAILDKYLKRYQALYDSGRGRIDSKKRLSKRMYQSVALHQEAAVGNLLRKRGVVGSGSVLSPLSESPFSSALVETSTSISVRGQAWVEDWEEEAQKKNDCVAAAQLLAKYKGLVFRDPDTRKSFLIWEQKMEFRRGRGNGWFLVGVCADDEDDNEVLTLEIA
jgi:hypothetical protein